MNRNVIKNSMDSLNENIRYLIQEYLNELPDSIPAIVTERQQLTVTVQSLISYGELDYQILKNIPILKNKYFHYPVKENDLGLLIPISYYYNNLVLDSETQITTKTKSSFMSNYIFIPISQIDTDFSGDDFIDFSGISSPENYSNIKFYDDKIQETIFDDDSNESNLLIEVDNIEANSTDGSDTSTLQIEPSGIHLTGPNDTIIDIVDSEITIQNSSGLSIIIDSSSITIDNNGVSIVLNSSAVEVNGNTDYAVKHTLLNTSLQTAITLINAEYTKLSTTIAQMVTAFAALGVTITPYTQGSVTLDISGAKDEGVKL